jgi:hypothetical protein
MAVCAHHVTLRDLVEDSAPAAPADTRGDRKLLLAEMIELEDDRVCLAAVGAWMRSEVLNEKRGALSHKRVFPPRRRGNVALSVCDVVRPFVGGTARAAIRIELSHGPSMPGELRDRLQLAAPAATLRSLTV